MQRIRTNKKVYYPELSYKICGIFFEVHNNLGRFRNEKQYADAIENLLKEKDINYFREKNLEVSFAGEKNIRNRVDFIIEDKIIIELKAKTVITKEDYFQMQRYLQTSDKKLGMLVNFRQKYLSPKRVVKKDS
jgi:GxxExxY protein